MNASRKLPSQDVGCGREAAQPANHGHAVARGAVPNRLRADRNVAPVSFWPTLVYAVMVVAAWAVFLYKWADIMGWWR